MFYLTWYKKGQNDACHEIFIVVIMQKQKNDSIFLGIKLKVNWGPDTIYNRN